MMVVSNHFLEAFVGSNLRFLSNILNSIWLNFCLKIWYKDGFKEGVYEIVERNHPRWRWFCIDVNCDGNDDSSTGILVNAVIKLRDCVPRAFLRVFES